ncbi:MAG: bifunctional ADP-dependent NAD(P)H-hydrate dehydratase/NAD(P)H-hydrate epimerase [Micrococcales bacterium]|nr:bifunctional ADP-dependent NAD(P)H-hydrate dehydratase/NAD(P)H-hydrate epimerase [Micrococcales bacterium]
MIRAYAIEVVRSVEQAAMADLPGGELMQRAARGLAEVAAARLEERDGRTVAALVGAGNNGGDTLYAAGLLAEAGFACVAVLLASSGREGTHGPALAAAESAGVAVIVAEGAPADAEGAVAEADVVLDGIVGIGARPGLRPGAVRLVDAVDDDAWVIAVDIASGLDPAGEVGDDDSVWADETVTFGAPKPCHLLPAGEAASGRLTVVDIGLSFEGRAAVVERLTHDDVAWMWPIPGPADDKYSRGVLGVVAGGESYSGAAVLSVTAAVETGAGMIRYVGTPTPEALVRTAVPEAVHGEGRVQAWLIGPGLSIEEAAGSVDGLEQLEVARDALAGDTPVVIDAGGLDLITGPDDRRETPTLLTPHAGELARLLSRLEASPGSPGSAGSSGVSRAEVEAEPLGHARRLAALTGATVLLKGATTLVVSPDPGDPVRSQTDAPAWLATAGAGDVLSGLLGMLMSAGLAPLDAGSLGALVHGVSADLVSGGGPVRALAVAHGIPVTVRRLLRRDSRDTAAT